MEKIFALLKTNLHTAVYFCLLFLFFKYDENKSRGAARCQQEIKYSCFSIINSMNGFNMSFIRGEKDLHEL